jgi:hypothetical protein
MKVFADTFYWIALTNPRDSFHPTVLEFSHSLRPQAIVTTNEVLTESLTFCAADRQLRVEAALVVNDVLAERAPFRPRFRKGNICCFAPMRAKNALRRQVRLRW